MNLRRTLIALTLAGITVFAAVGCTNTDKSATVAVQSLPAAEQQDSATPIPAQDPTAGVQQPTASPDGNSDAVNIPPSDSTRPAPPKGIQPPGEHPAAPQMDFEAAAAKLGVSEEQLREALTPEQGMPDITAAAQQLGVTEQALIEALGMTEGGLPRQAPPQPAPA